MASKSRRNIEIKQHQVGGESVMAAAGIGAMAARNHQS